METYGIIYLGPEWLPAAINSHGTVVGTGAAGDIYLEGGLAEKLSPLPGDAGCSASDINDANLVVGTSAGQTLRACRWQGGGGPALSIDPTSPYSEAHGVNNAGHIVGSHERAPVRWVGGVRQPLPVPCYLIWFS